MKKGLVVIAVLLACVFGFTGAALAAEISTSGRTEFKLTGTSEEGKASGLFQKGAVRIDYEVTLTSGSFETVLMPRFDLPSTLNWEKAYIKWSADSMNFQMHPLGLKDEFDLWDVSGSGGNPNIPNADAGIKFEVPVEPFTFSLGATNVAVADEAKFSYGFGAKYVINSVTLEGLFGNTDVETEDWYGSYYGSRVSVDLAPLTLEGQYGTFSPETKDGYKDGSGYFAKFAYALGEGLGTLTLKYYGADENLNGKGVATAKDYSKIYGEYMYPLTEAVDLFIDVAQIEPGTGADSHTEYEMKLRMNL